MITTFRQQQLKKQYYPIPQHKTNIIKTKHENSIDRVAVALMKSPHKQLHLLNTQRQSKIEPGRHIWGGYSRGKEPQLKWHLLLAPSDKLNVHELAHVAVIHC